MHADRSLPLHARLHLDRAKALRLAGGEHSFQEAMALLGRAARLAERFGMRRVMEQALALRAE